MPLMSGNLAVGQHGPALVAIGLVALFLHPAVVDIDVLIAVIGHAGGDHDIGGIAHVLLGDAVVVDVPAIPAHRRRQGQRVADHDLERPLAGPMLVLGPQRHGPFAPVLRDPAGDDAGSGVQLQALGQAGGREVDRPRPRAGNSIDERPSRPGAVDLRAVDLGLRPRLGRQNHPLLRRHLRRIDGHGPPAGHDELGLGPVRMVEIGPVARRGHHQPQTPDTRQRDIDGFGLLAAFHDAAVEEPLAVAINHESDRSPAARRVIDADKGLESFDFAVEIHVQRRFRVRPHASVERPPADRDRLARDALVGQRFAPPAGHLRKIQFPQAHDLGTRGITWHTTARRRRRRNHTRPGSHVSTLPFAYHQIGFYCGPDATKTALDKQATDRPSKKRRVHSRNGDSFFRKKVGFPACRILARLVA